MELPAPFLARIRRQLGEDAYACYLAAMERPPQRGLRVNTLKASTQAFAAICPWEVVPSPTAAEGFLLMEPGEQLGLHPLHRAGLFYLQEPSAMAAVALLDPQPGMCVLDLCAAPGGKAGQIASRLQGQGVLVANEVIPGRAQTLCRTLERLGVRNSMVTCMNPEALCGALAGWFDAALVDAPCSGEGMFRKDPEAIREWSPAHVEACALRQANILDSAARALKPGGRLLYSTCTFSPQEDEEAVEAFLKRQQGAFFLLQSHRLWPHTGPGEGHFMALLEKRSAGGLLTRPAALPRKAPQKGKTKGAPLAPWHDFVSEYMVQPPQGEPCVLPDGRLMLLPPGLPSCWETLRLCSCGVQAGEMKNGRFTPAHSLFMAYPGSVFSNSVSLSPEEIKEYFLGNTLPVPQSLRGWCAVLPQGVDWPAGYGKAVAGTLKNHLPKGLRG